MIVSLMKILPCKEYVEYFLDGKLYCNTVRYFRDEGYDEFEGAGFFCTRRPCASTRTRSPWRIWQGRWS